MSSANLLWASMAVARVLFPKTFTQPFLSTEGHPWPTFITSLPSSQIMGNWDSTTRMYFCKSFFFQVISCPGYTYKGFSLHTQDCYIIWVTNLGTIPGFFLPRPGSNKYYSLTIKVEAFFQCWSAFKQHKTHQNQQKSKFFS